MNLLLVGNDSRTDPDRGAPAELTPARPGFNTDTMILVHVPADGSARLVRLLPARLLRRDPRLRPGQAQRRLRLRHGRTPPRTPGGREAGPGRPAAGADHQRADRPADRPLRRGRPARLLQPHQRRRRRRGQPLQRGRRRRTPAPSSRPGRRRSPAPRRSPFVRQRHGLPARRLRPHRPPAGLHRRRAAQDAVRGRPARPRQAARARRGRRRVRSPSTTTSTCSSLAQQMQSVTPAASSSRPCPIVAPTARDEQGRSIVQLEDEDTLHAFFADLSAEPEKPAPTRGPRPAGDRSRAADVTVEVFNGSGTPGLAGTAAGQLDGGRVRRRRHRQRRLAGLHPDRDPATPPATRRSATRWPAAVPGARCRPPTRTCRPARSTWSSARTSTASASAVTAQPAAETTARTRPHRRRHHLHQLTG